MSATIRAKSENDEAAAKQLLKDMLNNRYIPNDPEGKQAMYNAEVIGRLVNVIKDQGILVNGQQPDATYDIADYLIHGGRINFTFENDDISQQDKNQFWRRLIGDADIFTRMTSSHGESVNKSGKPVERKFGNIGVVGNFVTNFFKWLGDSLIPGRTPKSDKTLSNNFGINLALGGYGETISKKSNDGSVQKETSKADGRFGHLFIYRGDNMIQLGCEGSQPGKRSYITDQLHLTAEPGDKSAFGVKKYHKFQKEGAVPLAVNGHDGELQKLDVFTIPMKNKSDYSKIYENLNPYNSYAQIDQNPANCREYHDANEINNTIQAAKQWQEDKHPTAVSEKGLSTPVQTNEQQPPGQDAAQASKQSNSMTAILKQTQAEKTGDIELDDIVSLDKQSSPQSDVSTSEEKQVKHQEQEKKAQKNQDDKNTPSKDSPSEEPEAKRTGSDFKPS